MRICVGDILTHAGIPSNIDNKKDYVVNINSKLYIPISFDYLLNDRLKDTYGEKVVYCWLFQNITKEIAKKIHEKLIFNNSYLGAMDIDYSNRLHFHFFKNSLVERYRLHNGRATIFYELGMSDHKNIGGEDLFKKYNFEFSYEDCGGRNTIFDKYITFNHFKRIGDFKKFAEKLKNIDEDYVSDIVHSLEELHPDLFDNLASAARALERSETKEDIAQASLSGRRLLEKMANYLFPPRKEPYENMKVGKSQYINRLLAYIYSVSDDDNIYEGLRKEVVRFDYMFNKGLHFELSKKELEDLFADTIIWLTNVIKLNISEARKPYLAYEQGINGELFG